MPELPIKEFDALTTHVIIQTVMLSADRERMCKYRFSLINAKIYFSLKSAGKDASLQRKNLEKLIDLPSSSEMEKQLQKEVQRGATAGYILQCLYTLNYNRKTPSFSKAMAMVQESYGAEAKKNRALDIAWSKNKLWDAWNGYKAIAPLWAAQQVLYTSPFERYQIKGLLACSESFADFGENLYLINRSKGGRGVKETVFAPGEVWRIPQNLRKTIPIVILPPPPPEKLS